MSNKYRSMVASSQLLSQFAKKNLTCPNFFWTSNFSIVRRLQIFTQRKDIEDVFQWTSTIRGCTLPDGGPITHNKSHRRRFLSVLKENFFLKIKFFLACYRWRESGWYFNRLEHGFPNFFIPFIIVSAIFWRLLNYPCQKNNSFMYVNAFNYHATFAKKYIIYNNNNKLNTKNTILKNGVFCYRLYNSYNNDNLYLYIDIYIYYIDVNSGSLTRLPSPTPATPREPWRAVWLPLSARVLLHWRIQLLLQNIYNGNTHKIIIFAI